MSGNPYTEFGGQETDAEVTFGFWDSSSQTFYAF